MTRAIVPILLLCLLAPAAFAADEPTLERVMAALPYLSSTVPEQQQQAESIIESGAEAWFTELVKALPEQPRTGREVLLRVLANTGHVARIELCVETLCNRDSRRAERIIASRALAGVAAENLLPLVEGRLQSEETSHYQRVQACALLGEIASARAQGVAEALLASSEAGGLLAFAAEDAALRSIIDSAFAQPAWARYQSRHEDAPRCTLRELQDALDDLALPSAIERVIAELRAEALINGDARVFLALARSRWPERSMFGLKMLKRHGDARYQLATQAVMLDLVMTGEQTIALMAMEVAIAGAPPTDSEMLVLRGVISTDSEQRLEAILEGMGRGTDLAALRLSYRRLEARLRPMLLRRGAFDPEVRRLITAFEISRTSLEQVEALWSGGWRTEFESEILGSSRR